MRLRAHRPEASAASFIISSISADARQPTIALERAGSGRPLALVHGLGASRTIWRHVLPALARRHATIALDVPGFGGSPPVGEGFALDEVADAIAAALPARRFDLVGHSMGGALALTLAARHPRRVRALVLVAPAGLRAYPPLAGELAGAVTEGLNVLRRAGVPLADRAWGRRLLLGTGTRDPGALAPIEVKLLVEASAGATRVREALAAVASADLRATLAELPLPVGAIWGGADQVIPPTGLELVRELRPQAPTAVVEDAGHIAMIERPAAFASALERVLAAL